MAFEEEEKAYEKNPLKQVQRLRLNALQCVIFSRLPFGKSIQQDFLST